MWSLETLDSKSPREAQPLSPCGLQPELRRREGRREPWWLPAAGQGRRAELLVGGEWAPGGWGAAPWQSLTNTGLGLWKSLWDEGSDVPAMTAMTRTARAYLCEVKGLLADADWWRFHSIHASLILSLDTLSWQGVVGRLHFSRAGRIVVLIVVT